jgi:hypothetical protein
MQTRIVNDVDFRGATFARDLVVLVSLPLLLIGSRCGMPA